MRHLKLFTALAAVLVLMFGTTGCDVRKPLSLISCLIAQQGPVQHVPVNPEKDVTVLLIPWPCPSSDIYRQVQTNMDIVITQLDVSREDCEVIIVQAPYADADNYHYINSTEWWGPEIRQARRHYSRYIDDGLVRLEDALTDEGLDEIGMRFTPSYYVFRKGKLVGSGNITKMARHYDDNL